MYLNKVIIIGNITRDIEIKTLPSGSYVCNIGVATNRSWKDKEGTKKEEVEYHNVVCFGKQAETIHQWCKKGDQIYIEGRLQTRSWEKDEQKFYKTEIVLENFMFGQKKGQNSSKTNEKIKDDDTHINDDKDTPSTQIDANNDISDTDVEPINPEDIPF
jgi:single-strand DNA-binding protein